MDIVKDLEGLYTTHCNIPAAATRIREAKSAGDNRKLTFIALYLTAMIEISKTYILYRNKLEETKSPFASYDIQIERLKKKIDTAYIFFKSVYSNHPPTPMANKIRDYKKMLPKTVLAAAHRKRTAHTFYKTIQSGQGIPASIGGDTDEMESTPTPAQPKDPGDDVNSSSSEKT